MTSLIKSTQNHFQLAIRDKLWLIFKFMLGHMYQRWEQGKLRCTEWGTRSIYVFFLFTYSDSFLFLLLINEEQLDHSRFGKTGWCASFLWGIIYTKTHNRNPSQKARAHVKCIPMRYLVCSFNICRLKHLALVMAIINGQFFGKWPYKDSVWMWQVPL